MNQDKTDIERITRIDDVHVSSPLDLDDDLTEMKAKGDYSDKAAWFVEKDGYWDRFLKEANETIAGENTAGKIIARGKDFISYFSPIAKLIDLITDPIGDAFKSKRTDTTMAKSKIKQTSTKAGIIILVAIAAYFGLDLNPDLLTVAINNLIQGGALIIAAGTSIYEMFRDEDKPSVQP